MERDKGIYNIFTESEFVLRDNNKGQRGNH